MFKKIDRRKARERFNSGKTFYMTPSKMTPRCDDYMGFSYTCVVDDYARACADDDFDALVNSFAYYNCGPEVGKNIAYYVWQD